MYTQQDILIRTLRAFDLWPTPQAIAQRPPDHIRQVIAEVTHRLDGPHLLVLQYLACLLITLQP